MKYFILFVFVIAVFFAGCGKYPIDQTYTTSEQWISYERQQDLEEIKKHQAAGEYESVEKKGNEFVVRFRNTSDQDVEEVMYLVGESFFLRRRYETAYTEFQKMIASYPYSAFKPSAMLRSADCKKLSSSWSFSEAALDYSDFLEKNPYHSLASEAQLSYGECLYREASTEVEFFSAAAELKKVLEKYPLEQNSEINRSCCLLLGKCYEEKPLPDYQMSIFWYNKFCENNQTYMAGDIWFHTGELYLLSADTASAKKAFEMVVLHYQNSTYYSQAKNRYYSL